MGGSTTCTRPDIGHRCCSPCAYLQKGSIIDYLLPFILLLSLLLTSVAALDVVARVSGAQTLCRGQVLGITVVHVHADSSDHGALLIQLEHP